MNYPRSQFSKHSHYFLISYGHCSNCATCAISGKVAGARGNRWKLLKDDFKCYISLPNTDPKWLQQISDYLLISICAPATLPLMAQVAQFEQWP